ncbi:hypothetical protein P171DRAFT_435921 [Karstenula rhodostoma CBS 690.94]|uniref:Cora-domain-containing protein n=1 Tax=Karstenula rhodostoma CBS 690.94 TaxID=1392251 RepID=A0A9P4U8E8_9PLEO|nr:hypothetical protein P171DRAFT_435921 [Karstenula rhodostoma CBS 690.94]
MDWPRDSAYLSGNESALKNVFKYSFSPSVAVRILQSNAYEPRVSVIATDKEWEEWAEEINYEDRGLVLILATRVGCQATMGMETQSISIHDFLSQAHKSLTTPFDIRRTQILSPLAEKPQIEEQPRFRGVRTVPFAQATFEFLANKMRTHESITRTISRSDVATFAFDKVHMHKPALVYSCRTSNAWNMDLALSQTHYPQAGLSLSILYGCDLSTNREVLRRLSVIAEEAAHPMIMPGILAEIELGRQIPIVEAEIISVETKILELDSAVTSYTDSASPVSLQKRIDKRSAWLDLAYLRNSLINWNAQLVKMADHTDEMEAASRRDIQHSQITPRAQVECATPTSYAPYSLPSGKPTSTETKMDVHNLAGEKPSLDTSASGRRDSEICQKPNGRGLSYSSSKHADKLAPKNPEGGFMTNTQLVLKEKMLPNSGTSDMGNCGGMLRESRGYHSSQTVRDDDDENAVEEIGDKIKRRLLSLQGEFVEMIQSCSMRLEGMAMATQWSHSETNVEIASATRQDSRIMKSISLVTMVFLPGTFFATVFSMTFFDWSGDSTSGSKARVSSYVWIYVVITAFFTAVTVAAWYYLVILRRRFKVMKLINSYVYHQGNV